MVQYWTNVYDYYLRGTYSETVTWFNIGQMLMIITFAARIVKQLLGSILDKC